jgi:hypothetical protein
MDACSGGCADPTGQPVLNYLRADLVPAASLGNWSPLDCGRGWDCFRAYGGLLGQLKPSGLH